MANVCSRGTLTAMLAEKEYDAVLRECPDRHESASFRGDSGFKTLQSGVTLFHNEYLHVWLQNCFVSVKPCPNPFTLHSNIAIDADVLGVAFCISLSLGVGMEGPPMTFVFHHGGLFKKNAEGDMIEDEVVNVEAARLKQGKCSSQPVKKPTRIDPQSQKQTCHPNRTTSQPKSQPKSQPNPTMKPISEPSQPKVKPMSQPNKAAQQPKKTTSQPKKTTAQPMKPVPEAKKTSYQAKSVPPQSNSSSEAGNNSQGTKDKQTSSGCRVTRSGRQVKEAQLQEDDTDSHDSYESTEAELYRPPKVVGDNLYSSESDSDSGKGKRSGKRDSRSEVREKQKPPKKRLADKEIDTDDSNYEGSEDEESSESDLDDSDAASDADSWHSEDSDKVLEFDEEAPAVYRQFNEKTKFGELKFEVSMDKNDKRAEDYCHDWLKMEAYRKTYCFNVNPVKGQDLWEKTPHPAPVPPPFKAKPRRPTKKRRREKDEQPTGSKTKMKRKYNPIRCMYCSEIGHNKRSCAKKKATEAEEHARQLQLQLALVAPAAEGAAPEATTVPAEPNPAPAPTQTPTVIDVSQCDSIPPTQETQQEQLAARPSKLKVIKGKARIQSSPKATVAAPVAISAETIKGTSSATAKKLADFMTLVPTPAFKPPRKIDK
ncbi:hypothetical protein Ahy_B08g093160 [Arachis hypogaea]|uniref:CCHC-type domain-containing protein n=1 Tax=Arachis hypogaea TaxID=3818 RepID=A0A444Y5B2_ARAHY|nr:hypothetical protein Ahy_B08g093160 [Arachis hypogaea]